MRGVAEQQSRRRGEQAVTEPPLPPQGMAPDIQKASNWVGGGGTEVGLKLLGVRPLHLLSWVG